MHDAASLEELGVPTAVVITEAFVREAQVQRDALGIAALKPVVITHPLSTLSDEEIAARAKEALPQITKSLLGR